MRLKRVLKWSAGLIPLFDLTGRANLGHALETVVLNELERRKAELGYVKTRDGFEVDFHSRLLTGEEELVQVCADMSNAETTARELRALEAAGKLYPKAAQRLLTLTRDSIPSGGPSGILIQPAYEWMLMTQP